MENISGNGYVVKVANSRSRLLKSLENIYSKYQESGDSSKSMDESKSKVGSKQSDTNLTQENLHKIKRIYLKDVTSDPAAQRLICRMKTILQTPGYVKLFKKMTHELRSDMDCIIIKMVNNDMTKDKDNPFKNAEHLILQGKIQEEKDRLKRYCGSLVVDEYYEYLAMQYYLELKKG